MEKVSQRQQDLLLVNLYFAFAKEHYSTFNHSLDVNAQQCPDCVFHAGKAMEVMTQLGWTHPEKEPEPVIEEDVIDPDDLESIIQGLLMRAIDDLNSLIDNPNFLITRNLFNSIMEDLDELERRSDAGDNK